MVAVGSDAGTLALLSWNTSSQRFEQAFGIRFDRGVSVQDTPGQLIAADPAGRAVLIGAASIAICVCSGESKRTHLLQYTHLRF